MSDDFSQLVLPTELLPKNSRVGNIMKLSVERDVQAELERQAKILSIQDRIA